MRGKLIHHPLRAPRESGETLITPSIADIPQLLESNRQAIHTADCDISGRSLVDLRRVARSQLIPLAVDYTNSYRDVQLASRSLEEAPLIAAGHQPQLFHPGVWFKNLALAASSHLPATTLNLIIDNDICLRPSIRVPGGSIENPRVEVIPYDSSLGGMPFEERRVSDKLAFNSFGQRVNDAIRTLVEKPLVQDLWPMAIERLAETGHLGLSLSQARHRLEEQWNLNTLELPLSRVCQTESFRVFAIHLLSECKRLRTDYNESLVEYRKVNRIRSRSHPVPELITEDDLVETPFWIWTTETPIRRRLFARVEGGDLYLTDRDRLVEKIEGGLSDVTKMAQWLGELEETRGIKIRPRALITTMFARLVLSDIFVHGIGGAKYDQLTDEIMTRFFDIEPPRFLTMTATLNLPLSLPPVTEGDLRDAIQELRTADYHPEKLIENGQVVGEIGSLLESKKYWINQSLPRGERGQRHRKIKGVNAALRRAVSEQRAILERTRDQLQETLRRNTNLSSREFSFCLFPRESFEGLLLALS
jgi:hypothetical protein